MPSWCTEYKPVTSGEFGAETDYWAWVRSHGFSWERTEGGPFFISAAWSGLTGCALLIQRGLASSLVRGSRGGEVRHTVHSDT